jgi:hypothetical protein
MGKSYSKYYPKANHRAGKFLGFSYLRLTPLLNRDFRITFKGGYKYGLFSCLVAWSTSWATCISLAL